MTLAGGSNHALKDLLGIAGQIIVTLPFLKEAVPTQSLACIKPFDNSSDCSVKCDLASMPLSLTESLAGSEKGPVQVHKLEETLSRR
jgi:hypothetical protein